MGKSFEYDHILLNTFDRRSISTALLVDLKQGGGIMGGWYNVHFHNHVEYKYAFAFESLQGQTQSK
jgi:hypothetical protein